MTEPVSLLRDGRYLRIWLIGWVTGIVRWLELLAFGIYAFEVTGSPVLVALVALIRFLPLALFSLAFGAAADQISPRKILFWSLAGVGLVTFAMAVIEAADALTYGLVLMASLVSGVFWASDMPLRRVMIGQIAGPDRLARAMAWDYATSNGTRMLGPLLGGVVYETIGMSGIFTLGAVLYAIALILAAGIAPIGVRRRARTSVWATMVGAGRTFRRAMRDNEARCLMAVTVAFNMWGFPFVSMIPVIGQDVLGLSASWIGYVSSIEGATGLVGVIVIGLMARSQGSRWLYIGGLALHLTAVGTIGLAPGLTNFALALAVAGLATAAFASMQATLIYVIAPPGQRGRYLGLISICIGSGLIGFANVGWMAELFGAPTALCIIAVEGLAATALIGWFWHGLHVELGWAKPRDAGSAAHIKS